VNRVLPIILAALSPLPAAAEDLTFIGVSSSGAQLFVDRATMKTNRPIPGQRPFESVQIWATFDLSGVRRDPARTEKALYSFNCRARTINTLAYRRTRANGTALHDWKAADYDFKYEAVKPGSLPEMAMFFACSGGKLPVAAAPQVAGGLVKVDDESE
jgi:hypothetical protein